MSKNQKSSAPAPQTEVIAIKPVNFKHLEFTVTGTGPLMQAKFSQITIDGMVDKMRQGSTAKSKKERKPRDFDSDFKAAMHISTEGWNGHPASAFRNACIDVCRMVGFKMTHAKMSIFVEADGLDKHDGQPLVRIIGKPPEKSQLMVRNATGVPDIRVRPMWREWAIKLRVKYDADQFTASDVANLLERAGQQVGIGEGRPFSKDSNGLGFGTFTIKSKREAA